MDLKVALEAIDVDTVVTAFRAHDHKTESLAKQNRSEDELDRQEETYDGLAHIPNMLMDAFINSGYDVDQALLIYLGASMTVHTIIEVAESQALPPLDT